MEVGGGSCAVCSDIQRLPEECVSRVISLTSPRDACRLEAVSAAFRSAAVSDDVWKSFLPYYAEILARAVDPMEFASIKQLYFRLCNPILIDDGKMGFFVDRDTGSKCFILSARELGIAWAVDTPQHWRWIQHPESMYRMAYEGAISTLPGKEQWYLDSDMPRVGVPNALRPRGRPKKNRYKNFMESVTSKATRVHKCSRCGQFGHHRSTCKNPLNQTIVHLVEAGQKSQSCFVEGET